LRPPRGDKVRGEANCVFQMKKKFDFLPLTNSELFIKMKGNSISDRDHFEVHNSSQRGRPLWSPDLGLQTKRSYTTSSSCDGCSTQRHDKTHSLCISFYTRGTQVFQKSTKHLKILCALRMTLSKFLTDDLQTLSATLKKTDDLSDLAKDIYTPLLYKLILSCIRNQKTGGGTHDKCR